MSSVGIIICIASKPEIQKVKYLDSCRLVFLNNNAK